MLLKMGVDVSRLDRRVRRVLGRIDDEYQKWSGEAVLTATYEGTHSTGSLHYANLAVDVRLPRSDPAGLCEKLRGVLGRDFDVIYETSHIHIEYDPK